MEDFSNLDPEVLQQLMELGIIPEEMGSLKDQISTAQALRDKGAPRGTDTGRVYVAANPLEHLAYTLNGMKAGKEIDKARAEQQKLLAQQVRGRKSYFDAMNEIQPFDPSVSRQGPPPGGY